jgi:3-oxoacyl-[acyl-carrier-protein] synthase III
MNKNNTSHQTLAAPNPGVKIIGTGHKIPDQVMTNDDLKQYMETSDEWIRQRTGIIERRIVDPAKGENVVWMCTNALQAAIEDAGIDASEIDLVIVGTVSGTMTCPSTACRVAAEVGAIGAGAFDVLAACSAFVYGTNIAHDLIRGGNYKTIAVIGCDLMSSLLDYSNRSVSILFGDAAGAAILRASDDPTKGTLTSVMHADGRGWTDLFIPTRESDFPESQPDEYRLGTLRMNGRSVYKFAVSKFPQLIQETLDKVELTASDIDLFVCHQSNLRMLESARERFGIPEEKMPINIDRLGNCSAGSVATLLDESRKAGKCKEGDLVMLLAFGGGLTWASSLWRL